ncbi:MAG: LexA family transcriptional regulator [Holophagaceae bacterium]|nr:LexA family transcriptional regulator [Holophagaceae bacterium]
MQTTVAQRLMATRKATGLSLRDFSKPLGVHFSTLAAWEKGKVELSDFEAIKSLVHHYNISEEWLMTGKGEMMVADNPSKAPLARTSGDTDFVGIGFADIKASAGGGTVVEFEPIDNTCLLFGRQWLHDRIGIASESLLMLSVDGDSMFPTLCPNDLIMVDRSAMGSGFKDGIWVFSLDNAVHVKRVQQMGHGQFKAISDNKDYQSFMLEEPCHFIGRVVWSDKRW